MRKSDLILPLRIFDDVYDQRRFNRLCPQDCCDQAFNVSSEKLPFFQFTRSSNIYTPERLTLKKVSNDQNGDIYQARTPEGATFKDESVWGGFPKQQTFMVNNGVDPPFTVIHDMIARSACGVTNSYLTYLGDPGTTPLSADQYLTVGGVVAGYRYRLKITVSKFVLNGGSSFAIKIYDCYSCSPHVIATIDAVGTYVIEFRATQTGSLDVRFDDIEEGDEYEITYLNNTLLTPTDITGLSSGDVQLDETMVKTLQMANGEDLIVFCYDPDTTSFDIAPGDYYYIIEMSDGTLFYDTYYSEIFRVKRPVDLEPYYKLYWRNTVDISGAVRYTASAGSSCIYFNEIYLDAGLFGPNYENKTEFVENGEGDQNPVFRRWHKSLKMDIVKCPPHMTDAFSALFLHNIINLTEPTNNDRQDERPDEHGIERVTVEIEDVLNNCYQAVIVNFYVPTRKVQTGCDGNVEYFECGTNTPTLDDATEIGDPGSQVYLLEGTGKPYATAVGQYNLNGGGWITPPDSSVLIDGNGDFALVFDLSDLTGATDLDVRVAEQAVGCTYGNTAAIDVI